MLAPVCSSWIWLNRASSGRSRLCPLGYHWIPRVRQANVMVSRAALMCILLTSRGILRLLEQPKNSAMECHPRFQWLVKRLGVYRVSINMGDYGGETLKPSWIYSAHECINQLPTYMTQKFMKNTRKKAAQCSCYMFSLNWAHSTLAYVY